MPTSSFAHYLYYTKPSHAINVVSRNLNLVEVCEVNVHFAIFCEIFEQASFSMAARAYANNDGFGSE